MSTLRIGTRKSQLALWQANYVKEQLFIHHPGLTVELVEIVSEGDRTLDVPLSQVGGKGLFLKELETALLQGDVDIAVHSMKDVTVDLPHGLFISVICAREDPRDAFVSNRFQRLDQMPHGARLGTCSLRRQCQMRATFPKLDVVNLRGNVNTRLSRLDAGDYDGLILAAAGLKRLEMDERISQLLDKKLCLPAVGQGAVGIECRQDDPRTLELIEPLNDTETMITVSVERAVNALLGGGCHVPIGVHAKLNGNEMIINALVGKVDGTTLLRSRKSGSIDKSESLAGQVADDLIAQGAEEILASVYAGD